MRTYLNKALAYLPHTIVAIIVVLIAVLGYQHYATDRAIDRARQAGEMAVLGNTQADITVVAYFDYNCPPCATAGKALTQVLNNRRDIRVIVRPLGMLGKKSKKLAEFAIAAALQGKFQAYHSAFLDEMVRQAQGTKGQLELGRTDALRVARAAGLDTDRLQKMAESKRMKTIFERNTETAEQLGVQAIPTYIIGRRSYTPYYKTPKADDFQRMIDAVQGAS